MREIITLPSTTEFGSFDMSSQTFDMDEVSDITGSTDTVIYGHPRWRVSLSAKRNLSLAEASFWEYVLLSLKGKANRLAVWDPVRTAPAGTMRGSPVVLGALAAGDTSMVINAGGGQANTTLLRGDFLQIGTGLGTSQLVKVANNVTLDSSGQGTVTFNHYLRRAISNGTAIVWDRPVAYYASIVKPTGWSYATNAPLVDGFAFDLLEQWS